MRIIKISENSEIVCTAGDTRNGFKHEAALMVDGREQCRVKINYLNRTWERFTYESVIEKLLDKAGLFTDPEARKAWMGEVMAGDPELSSLSLVGVVMRLGEIFHEKDQKASNDWKLRMMKAGIGNKGLIMPEDWDQLSEDEKTIRLNGVMEVLK